MEDGNRWAEWRGNRVGKPVVQGVLLLFGLSFHGSIRRYFVSLDVFLFQFLLRTATPFRFSSPPPPPDIRALLDNNAQRQLLKTV